jgi:conjugal transfer ATP-binding protein TraC
VGRLRLDPFSRLLYSTNAEEYQAIESHIKRGASIEEAIENVIERQNSKRDVATQGEENLFER